MTDREKILLFLLISVSFSAVLWAQTGTYFGEVNSSTGALTWSGTAGYFAGYSQFNQAQTYTCTLTGSQTLNKVSVWAEDTASGATGRIRLSVWNAAGTTMYYDSGTGGMTLTGGTTPQWYDVTPSSVSLNCGSGSTQFLIWMAGGKGTGTNGANNNYSYNTAGSATIAYDTTTDYVTGSLPSTVPTFSSGSNYPTGLRFEVGASAPPPTGNGFINQQVSPGK